MKRAIPILPGTRSSRQREQEKVPTYKRARASKPKVKSGCITCKIRRVKCDETKPECIRCLKFGRSCDGEDESRYFQMFCGESASQLSGFFETDFWTRVVLQETHSITPIRYAVIAIGALHKSLEAAPKPDLKVNVIQTVDKGHLEAAVYNYSKAIQTLNQYISQSHAPQLRIALISCLLFVCFETFMGAFSNSVQQTYGGLKILRNYYMGKAGSKPWIPRKSIPVNKRIKTREIIKTIETRPGCDKVSQDRTVLTHLEEYLNGDVEVEETGTEASNDSLKEQRKASSIQTKSQSSVQQQAAVSFPTRSRPLIPKFDSRSMDLHDQGAFYSKNPSTVTPYVVTDSTGFAPVGNVLTEASHALSSDSMPISTSPVPGIKQAIASRVAMPASTPVLHNDNPIEDSLIQTFVRVDGQGMFFGMVPRIPPLRWDIHKTHHFDVPLTFTDFPTAQRCWDFLMDRCLQFYRGTLFDRAYAPSNSLPVDQIATLYTHHRTQLSLFAAAYAPLLAANLPPNEISNPAVLVVSLHHAATNITLSAVPSDLETVFDAHLLDFKHILHLSSLLLSHPTPRFTFEIGLIPALHLVATKCRDPVLRREAIAMLFSSPRQEGMWDGVLTARVGTWIMGCEEEGVEGWVEEEKRVRLTVVDFHISERFIIVKCERSMAGADGKKETRETTVAW